MNYSSMKQQSKTILNALLTALHYPPDTTAICQRHVCRQRWWQNGAACTDLPITDNITNNTPNNASETRAAL